MQIKKIISKILSGIIIVCACYGGYTLYMQFKPITVTQQDLQTNTMRVKLESIGKIKVAEAEQKIKQTKVKGNLFKNVYKMIHYYKTNYEYDLKDIKILSEINNKKVTMEIDTNKLTLGDVYLIRDDSYSDSSFPIAPTIKEDEKEEMRKNGNKEVTKLFKSDEEFKSTAVESLKQKLYNLAESLGFEEITINVI